MANAMRLRAPSVRAWPMFSDPPALRAVVLVTDLLAVIVAGWTLATSTIDTRSAVVVALLAATALGFEETTTRLARLQLRISADLKRDMTSVWAVAAAAALSPIGAMLLLTTIYGYMWFRQQRPAGEALFRKVFNFSNSLTACLIALGACRAVDHSLHHWSAPLAGLARVLVAIAVFAVINRMIVTVGFVSLGARGKALLGSANDNLVEFATLCLGGLVSVAILFQPLLALLVLAPMVTMQRGAVMRELETAATTDAKTGLLNAVAWEELASRELVRAAREGNELSVLIVDVDHFKRVNDRHGHLVGDRVLRQIGKVMDAETREFDSVARFGGEEFVAVLPSAGTVDALVVAERLRSTVNRLRISDIVESVAPELDDTIAVSIGLATAPADGVELADLLHAADSALYRAKAQGRNRVVVADPGPGSGRSSAFSPVSG